MGGGVFCDCTALQDIVLPDSLSEVGNEVFGGCNSLKRVKLSEQMTEIPAAMFQLCGNLSTITLPSGIKKIGSCAFEECISLTDIKLPEGLKEIGSLAFHDCKELAEIELPEGLEKLGDFAFQNCDRFLSMIIPGNQLQFGEQVFASCETTLELWFYGEAPLFQETTFQDASAFIRYRKEKNGWAEAAGNNYGGRLTWNMFDPEAEILADGTCSGNDSIAWWSLSREGILTIGGIGNISGDLLWNGFRSRIRQIYVEDGVKNIEERAFADCINLEAFSASKDLERIKDQVFYRCRKLKKVDLPGRLIEFGNGAFMECRSLTEITIPMNMRLLGNRIFYGCNNLKTIYFEGPMMYSRAGEPLYGVNADVYCSSKFSAFNTEEKRESLGGTLQWHEYLPEERTVWSGTGGENVFWNISSWGTMTISGGGEMKKNKESDQWPWQSDEGWMWETNKCWYVTKIVIQADVTMIGDDVFAMMPIAQEIHFLGNREKCVLGNRGNGLLSGR